MSRIALVVAGGDRPSPKILAVLPPPVLTIAADSGVDHARLLGLTVDAVVGDLDSATADGVDWARGVGADVQSHPPDKDQTDLELALLYATGQDIAAQEKGLDEMVVIGLDGGRVDHWLANLLVLAGPRTEAISTTAYLGDCRVSVVRGQRTLYGRPGELVTLLPVGGAAAGVTTSGLLYPLNDEVLEAGTARGVSNLFDGVTAEDISEDIADSDGVVTATVTIKSGTLLVLQPHALRGSDSVHPPSSFERDG